MEINKLSGIVWVPKTGTTYGILNALAENVVTLDNSCPVEYLKSIKNIVEQEGMKRSNLYDSVAISEALMNVEERLQKQTTITELDVVYNLVHLRKEIDPDYYKGESFECISAAGPNAANNHYSPTDETDRQIFTNETFLLDTGGQYLDGTTDITRVIFVGNPPEEIITRYTQVMLGNMHLSNSEFPTGTPGYQMEPLARQPLFRDHKNYGHGTGHGIGHYLLIHELPNGIGTLPSSYNYAGFVSGMVESIEPGFYVSESYGIRLEDDVLVTDNGDNFIGFQKLSLVPYEPNLINFSMMSKEDLESLQAYHAKCQETADLARKLNRVGVAEWIEERIRNVHPENGTRSITKSSFLFVVILFFSS